MSSKVELVCAQCGCSAVTAQHALDVCGDDEIDAILFLSSSSATAAAPGAEPGQGRPTGDSDGDDARVTTGSALVGDDEPSSSVELLVVSAQCTRAQAEEALRKCNDDLVNALLLLASVARPPPVPRKPTVQLRGRGRVRDAKQEIAPQQHQQQQEQQQQDQQQGADAADGAREHDDGDDDDFAAALTRRLRDTREPSGESVERSGDDVSVVCDADGGDADGDDADDEFASELVLRLGATQKRFRVASEIHSSEKSFFECLFRLRDIFVVHLMLQPRPLSSLAKLQRYGCAVRRGPDTSLSVTRAQHHRTVDPGVAGHPQTARGLHGPLERCHCRVCVFRDHSLARGRVLPICTAVPARAG